MSTFAKKVTSAVLTSAVVLSTVAAGANGVSAAFTNLEAANKLANLNVIVDKSNNPASYRLGDTIQRQEALKIMMKLSGLNVSNGSCTSPFSDISNSSWACKYAVAATNAGFIARNKNFNPANKVSKIEALKMVMKARGIAKSTSVSDWKAAYVKAAVEANLVSNFSDYTTASERGFMFVTASNAIDHKVATENPIDSIAKIISDLDETKTKIEIKKVEAKKVVYTGKDQLTVSLNPETPSNGLAQANTARVPLLVFDVKAGSKDITLKEITLEFLGLGDNKNLQDVSVYNDRGEKISKTKSFKEVEREISFDRDIIVEAGQTMTLTVAGKIETGTSSENVTYGIKITDLKASSDVVGDTLIGALLVPAKFANVAAIEISEKRSNGTIQVGEEVSLAGFEIREVNDKEDAIVKTITLHLSGSLDSSDLSNLSLYADGKEIVSDLQINSDDEIVIPANVLLEADDRIKFELKGTVTGFDNLSDKLQITFESNDDVYVIGSNSGMPVAIAQERGTNGTSSTPEIKDEKICGVRNIEGSEINISFIEGEKDETKTDRDDFLIGTLKATSGSDSYEVKKIQVTVTSSKDNVVDLIKDIKLGGDSFDHANYNQINGSTGAVFDFTDIVLKRNEQRILPLTFDVEKDTKLNGNELTFKIEVIEVEDDNNDITYVNGDLNKVLSATSFSTKKVTIESASITLTKVNVNNRILVLGNSDATVYKAKISLGDSDDITITDFTLTQPQTATAGVFEHDANGLPDTSKRIYLDKIVDSAVLNIGGRTFTADVRSDRLEFNNVDAVIAAGTDDMLMSVVVRLKDDDSLTTADNKLVLELSNGADLEAEDSEGKRIENRKIAVGSVTETTLRENGTLKISFDTDEDRRGLTGVDKFALAGTRGIVLAKVELDSKYEDAKIKDFTFTISGSTDFSDTLNNIKLVSKNGSTLVSGGKVSYTDAVINSSGAITASGYSEILFEDDFTISEAGKTVAYLVTDLNAITDEGGFTTSNTGAVIVSIATGSTKIDVEGATSLDTYTLSGGIDATHNLAVKSNEVSKKVTVAANTVAGVTLTKATSSLSSASTGSGAVLAKLTVDTSNQTFNKYDDGAEIIEAAIKKLNLEVGGAAVITGIKLSRAGITIDGNLASGKATFDFSASGAFVDDKAKENFATIDDGKAEFDIIVDYTADPDTDLTIKIADISKDIILDDGKDVEINKVYSAKTSASSKTTEVTISR